VHGLRETLKLFDHDLSSATLRIQVGKRVSRSVIDSRVKTCNYGLICIILRLHLQAYCFVFEILRAGVVPAKCGPWSFQDHAKLLFLRPNAAKSLNVFVYKIL